MLFTRRELLRMAGLATLTVPLGSLPRRLPVGERRLFFDLDDLPRIKKNAASPLLGPSFESWRSVDPAVTRATIDRVLESQEFLTDLGAAVEAIYRETTMLLVTGDDRHDEMVRHGLDVLVQLPAWDYLLEDGKFVLGLMRASKATTLVVYAIEVLGDRLDAKTRTSLLKNVAEKGCVTCALTLRQMDHPEEVVGWGVDALHKDRYKLDMSRWPTILGHNNLRAIPTMGLGMGALALEGRDPRSAEWLDQAVSSARTFLRLFEPDGSYFEGISYVDFAFRTMLIFLEAHYRTHGDVEWIAEANFHGIVEYIVCLQNGLKPDGTPDIINISDARNSVFPCVPSWIAKRSGDPLAQYAASHMSNPGFYSDFLWYDPSRPEEPPPDELLNKRFDLDWIVTRTGWSPEDAVVAFRSGPPLNHEHADRNSIMVKAYGERLLTDPFGASYDPEAPTWLLRLTEAHNAVLIDGRGHQYHHGEEGVNASKAHAEIVAYEDRGAVVWWSSDATQAYKLVRPDVKRVVRSVLFVKPDIIVMVDRLEMDSMSASLSARLHPDNRDMDAELIIGDGGAFDIRRPNGVLIAASKAMVDLKITEGRLDLPASYGVFPFVEITAPPATETTIVTAIALYSSEIERADRPAIVRESDRWRVMIGDRSVEIANADDLPRFEIT